MENIKISIMTKEYCFGDRFKGIVKLGDNGREAALKYYIESVRQYGFVGTDRELLSKIIVKKLKSPSTFPKFSNESKFKAVYGNQIYRQGEITAIRWNGEQWEYQIKNIGHIYDFTPENRLVEL